MDKVIRIASLRIIEISEDGGKVPAEVAQTLEDYRIDSYTKDWYESMKKEISKFGLSDYLMSYLLGLALRATIETMGHVRKAADHVLRKQKSSFLTEREIDAILHILF